VRALALATALAAAAAPGCDAGGVPRGWRSTPPGEGPRVRWDLAARPLPEIPLPNDVATWPDPSSPTGRRLNPSFLAPTEVESTIREQLGTLDGWGAYAPITVSFDADIDVEELIRRQGGDRFSTRDFAEHAIYLVDLETGVPVPIDIHGGHFHYALARTGRYYPNDPRQDEANLLFESVEEDLDGDGVLDPGEDTDFDGVLDHPNTIDGRPGATPEDTYDRMLWFYERETHTLFLRPILPLEERRTYAVVLTDRLRDPEGRPVRSPFDDVHHVSQTRPLARLPAHFAARPEIYGDLAVRGWDGVAFAWSFTTQSITRGLDEVRDGLYGRGRLAFLAEQFPPDLLVAPLRGGNEAFPCDPGPRVHVVTFEELRPAIEEVAATAFGLDGEGVAALLDTFDQVSHFVVGFFESPYLLGDPDSTDPRTHWDLDRTARERTAARDRVPFVLAVPRETATRRQPFPVTLYGHGYTSTNLEALAFAGLMARTGVATASIVAEGHGLGLDRALRAAVEGIFASHCLAPMGRAIVIDRARDLDGDGVPDSGGNFWSAYVFHTRDVVRQTVVDHLQFIRILRHFGDEAPGGPRRAATGEISVPGVPTIRITGDFDGDGSPDLAGDFDGNGRIDVGGWRGSYSAWGQSLGGFISSILAGVEPAIRTAAPTSGAGGLIDVGVRSQIESVRDAVILRMMGPLVLSEPAPSDGPSATTACDPGERRLSFLATSVNRRVRVEFACLGADALAPGDAVVVRNLRSGEARCAGVVADGRFRVAIPTDAGDPLVVEIYRGAREALDYATCSTRDGTRLRPAMVIDEFLVGRGRGEDRCATCATYADRSWNRGDRLVAPTEGFGLRRQTPSFRRFLQVAQLALEPGDPIHYVRRVFLRPVSAPDWDVPGPRSLLVASSIGDQDVPISAGNAMARAAGLLPFLPADSPRELGDWAAPADFEIAYPGTTSPHELLVDLHVLEGVPRLRRHPIPENPEFLADPDDLGDGRQLYTASGGVGGTLAPVRASPPLRWTRSSVPFAVDETPFDPPAGGFEALSGVLNVYVKPLGNHGTEPPTPEKTWDEGVYYVHLIGRWFATGGADLRYHTDPRGHLCLEDATCDFFERVRAP
jgi:hypothetical protein